MARQESHPPVLGHHPSGVPLGQDAASADNDCGPRPAGNDRRVYLQGADRGVALADPAAAVTSALAAPIGYPPLAEAIVPGDRVAVAIDERVPKALSIVRGVILSFVKSGVDPEAISIVTASKELAGRFRQELSGNEAGSVQIVLHDPDDEMNLCFVGLTKEGTPLVVNRAIHEADVVLPVGARRPGGGAYDSLFPQLSSAAVIEEYRTPANLNTHVQRKARRLQAREAGWLIGTALAVEVVPGPSDSVTHVLAGEAMAVGRQAARLYRQQWRRGGARPVGLVIAVVSGGPMSQTWQNVGLALSAAGRLLEEHGAVALCTNLDQPLGESMGQLLGAFNLNKTQKKLLHEHANDSWAAWQLARALKSRARLSTQPVGRRDGRGAGHGAGGRRGRNRAAGRAAGELYCPR